MKYRSTRHQAPSVNFSDAVITGLAPDGGLYVPESFPAFDLKKVEDISDYPAFAAIVLQPFVQDDPLSPELPGICQNAFPFPIPITTQATYSVLELYHGPTAAFKDVGASFLAQCMNKIGRHKNPPPQRTILVATSGDTGGAVANAFYQMPNIKVGVLFPRQGVSPLQRAQLICYGKNILSFSVNGCFDDCQKIVKQAFSDRSWREKLGLTSANSINIGRILPQMTYYCYASFHYHKKTGKIPNFIIPTGNLGNAVAAFWAKSIGFPIGQIILSLNANQVIKDYLTLQTFTPRQSIPTLANAMDVGNPSNLERLIDLYPTIELLGQTCSAFSFNDAAISKTIQDLFNNEQQIYCPHTATARAALDQVSPHLPWIIVSTAHPAKFKETIEPIVGTTIPIPDRLSALLGRPAFVTETEVDLDFIMNHLAAN